MTSSSSTRVAAGRNAPLDRYLDRICRRLWLVPARERRETREELRQHLEKMAAHAARTVEPMAAMEDAMKKFGDPGEIGGELSRQHLRRRRWPALLLRLTTGLALLLLTLTLGYGGYCYFALSKPVEQETLPTPTASGAAALASIQAAQDKYARQIHSVRFQNTYIIRSVKDWHGLQYGIDATFPETYEVATKGKMYYSHSVTDERYGAKPDETTHADDTHTFDGQTMREVRTEWNGPAGGARARQTYNVSAYLLDNRYKPFDPDDVLESGYKVHSAWVGDVLRRSHPVVEGTVNDARFGTLTVVRCRDTVWGEPETVRLWFAPKLGWLAVKTETNFGGPGLLPPIPEIGLLLPPPPTREVRETTAVAKIGTLWVTTDARRHMAYLSGGRQVQIATGPLHFTNVTVNAVPDSLFVPHYPARTVFWSQGDERHPSVPVPRPAGQ